MPLAETTSERGRRLVGEDDVRAGNESPGDGGTLLLAARQRVRETAELRADPDGRAEAGHGVLADPAAIQARRQRDVLRGRQGQHQVQRLEHEPDLAAAQHRELAAAETGQVSPADPDGSRGRLVQAGGALQQRGLARAGRADDSGNGAAGKPHRHVAERLHLAAAAAVAAADAVQDDRLGSRGRLAVVGVAGGDAGLGAGMGEGGCRLHAFQPAVEGLPVALRQPPEPG
jgi:hypothetical protein